MSESKSEQHLIAQRYNKLKQIRTLGYAVYPNTYKATHFLGQILSQHQDTSKLELEAERINVKVRGRIVAMRGQGKAGFINLSDGDHRLQIYLRKDNLGEKNFQLYRLLDLGDFVGVEGYLFRTRTEELTVHAENIVFLAKSLLPLPEKWHGLSDVEIRYRQRYLDLISNKKVRAVFQTRSKIIKGIRNFLDEMNYIEVETPMMQVVAGGASARPFKTFHNALNLPLFLRIAPELYLKRLIVGQLERVYEINRNFRNEGISTRHNPEFTMVEFYQSYSDYFELMDLTENLMKRLALEIFGSLEFEYNGDQISFDVWSRYSLKDAIQKFWPTSELFSLKSHDLEDTGRLNYICEKWNEHAISNELDQIPFRQSDSKGKILAGLFDVVVEKHLIQPTIIYDYPLELSPLSKTKPSDPMVAERFELFIAGMEIANAYSELNDPQEQQNRFEAQMVSRSEGDEEAHQMDEDYVRALCYGMPPTAGEGIGIDRLTMLFTNSLSIRDVILFPLLKPEKRAKNDV